jgi:hypothetical protein
VPIEVGVKVPEVALEVVAVAGAKFAVGGSAVPLGHSAGPAKGPHTLKATLPSGGPPVALPVTVTVSVAVPVGPITSVPGDAVVVLDEDTGVTMKHSVPVCWGTLLYGLPDAATKDALKHQVPTFGVCGVGRVKIESNPLVVVVEVESMGVPPVHGVDGALSWQSVQLTVPMGGPPTEFPIAVAVSPQVLPTAVLPGGRIVVNIPPVTAMALKHSAGSAVPVTLSLEPV